MTIEQVVAIAGDGSLRDQAESSLEFRQFLRVVPSDRLFSYARHCLESAFTKSGLVLQDIVNEFGQRLDFDVENGLYQGRNAVGFDGIWRLTGETEILLEVKTTDHATISLDRLADYRDRLAEDKRVQRNASMLVVVGREDTGALEAQVRGSRYAWDMRLISVEGLIQLVQIKEKSDEPNTLRQIRQLLQPFEYTKLDKIIDVIFTTAVDVESQQETEEGVLPSAENQDQYRQVRADPERLDAKRQEAVDAFAALKGKELVRRSRTLFWSPDKEMRVCCAVSNRYEGDDQPYCYVFHPKWDEFLADGKESYLILSCVDLDYAFAVSYSWLAANKKFLTMTERGERSYWNIALTTLEDGKFGIDFSRIREQVALAPFQYDFRKAATA